MSSAASSHDDGAHERVTAPGGDRPRSFRGPREVIRTAARAAAGLPQWAAILLLSGAFVSAWFGAPYPVTTFIAAFAAGASLPAARTGNASIVLLAFVALAIATPLSLAVAPIRPCCVVAIAAVIGMGLNARLSAARPVAPIEDRAGTFLAAAQRHPWACTMIVALVVAADAVFCADGRMSAMYVAVVGSAVPALLVARTGDTIGRLAPAAVGAPIVLLGFAAAAGRSRQVDMDEDVLIFAGLIITWTVALSYAIGRRGPPRPVHTALAWTWVALAVVIEPLGVVMMRGIAMQTIETAAMGASVLVVTAPFLFAAAASLSSRPAFAVPIAALATGASGAIALALSAATAQEHVSWQFEQREPWFGINFSDGGFAASFEFALRHAELGALCMGIGAVLGRARSLTALPADHPVFTEGPYLTRRASVADSLVPALAVPTLESQVPARTP